MQAYLTMVRRELGGYFFAFTGYVITAVVLLLLGFCFVHMVGRLNGEATEAPITQGFYSTLYPWIILLLTAPVMTMRTFAQEKALGTYENLMTTPISDMQVVMAKFTGALLFYLIAWSPMVAYLALVHYFTGQSSASMNAWTLGGTMLGIFLVGCLFMSMGVFASSLTRSQIIAAVLSYAMGLILFVLSLRPVMQSPAPGWPTDFFAHTSIIQHMEEFSNGIIDSRYIVFYVTMTILFLFLTHKVVESRRWK